MTATSDPSCALVLVTDAPRSWATMADDERRRRATEAPHVHDSDTLYKLTHAWLLLYGRRGARLADHTWERYQAAILELFADWVDENLLRPRRNAGALWARELEGRGLAPPSVRIRLAAGRALYAALVVRQGFFEQLTPLDWAHRYCQNFG